MKRRKLGEEPNPLQVLAGSLPAHPESSAHAERYRAHRLAFGMCNVVILCDFRFARLHDRLMVSYMVVCTGMIGVDPQSVVDHYFLIFTECYLRGVSARQL